jgi:hypothetical protein
VEVSEPQALYFNAYGTTMRLVAVRPSRDGYLEATAANARSLQGAAAVRMTTESGESLDGAMEYAVSELRYTEDGLAHFRLKLERGPAAAPPSRSESRKGGCDRDDRDRDSETGGSDAGTLVRTDTRVAVRDYGRYRYAPLVVSRCHGTEVGRPLDKPGGLATWVSVIGTTITATPLPASPSGALAFEGAPLLAVQYIIGGLLTVVAGAPTVYITTLVPVTTSTLPPAYALTSDACGLRVCCPRIELWVGISGPSADGVVPAFPVGFGLPLLAGTITVRGMLGPSTPVTSPIVFNVPSRASVAGAPLVPYVIVGEVACGACPFRECVKLPPLRSGTTTATEIGRSDARYFWWSVTSNFPTGAFDTGVALALVATARTVPLHRA